MPNLERSRALLRFVYGEHANSQMELLRHGYWSLVEPAGLAKVKQVIASSDSHNLLLLLSIFPTCGRNSAFSSGRSRSRRREPCAGHRRVAARNENKACYFIPQIP